MFLNIGITLAVEKYGIIAKMDYLISYLISYFRWTNSNNKHYFFNFTSYLKNLRKWNIKADLKNSNLIDKLE